MSFTADDHRHMAEALKLAVRGRTTTDPNPAVGCVIVRNDEVVGRGWHRAAGEPHAEILALGRAGVRARQSKVYVTLEPCSHQGRTPPCTTSLLEAGVSEVITAMADPNPQVGGKGHALLARGGIQVRSGLMEAQARDLNRGFVARHERGRPWVRIKLAASQDGLTAGADNRSQWITGEAARADVQRWRARASCILTGIGTVLADDPLLNVRLPGFTRHPLRVVVDSRARLPVNLRMSSQPGLIAAATCADSPPLRDDVRWWPMPAGRDGRVCLDALLKRLAEEEINTVHVEAGPILCGALVEAGLADELLVYQSACLIGNGHPLLSFPGMEKFADRLHIQRIQERRVGEDWRFLFRLPV